MVCSVLSSTLASWHRSDWRHHDAGHLIDCHPNLQGTTVGPTWNMVQNPRTYLSFSGNIKIKCHEGWNFHFCLCWHLVIISISFADNIGLGLLHIGWIRRKVGCISSRKMSQRYWSSICGEKRRVKENAVDFFWSSHPGCSMFHPEKRLELF